MPPGKRSHGRITSGSMRPHKSARFGQESSDDDVFSDEDLNGDVPMSDEPFISNVPVYQSLNVNHTRQPMTMRVAQVVAWPTSLAAIKKEFLYNMTPQDGRLLPDHVLQSVSNRILRPAMRDDADVAFRIPYLHLGYAQFLDLQLFIFLPNLRLANCYEQDPGRIYDFRLERWTDSVFIPAISMNKAHDLPTWRQTFLNSQSQENYNEDATSSQIYRLADDPPGQYFYKVWQRIQDFSMKIPEFQHPFLVIYSDGQCPQVFHSDNPDESMHEFETQWHENIDMMHITSPHHNVQVDFDYGRSNEMRDLPMR